MKTCTKCNRLLPLSEFHKDRKSKDGHVAQCKTCVSIRQGCNPLPRASKEGMHVCTTCLRELPFDSFTKAQRGKHGLNRQCKDCNYEYREQNKERITLYNQRYRRENADQIKERHRIYYYANAERINARVAQWRAENPDKARSYSRAFYRRHPERSRPHVVNRRARRMAAPGRFTLADEREKYATQSGLCYWCSEPLPDVYHRDHVIPLSKGGTNWPDNIVLSCPDCNFTKSDRLPYSEWEPPNPLD